MVKVGYGCGAVGACDESEGVILEGLEIVCVCGCEVCGPGGETYDSVGLMYCL